MIARVLDGRTPRVDGATRTRRPEETAALLATRLAEAGITRVANVTGLDRIGVPVYQAVRPNARTLSVAQGKGVTASAARASAIMEGVELWHAEHATCPVRIASYLELAATARVTTPDLLPLSRRTTFAPTTPLPWTEGVDLESREPIWVPFELVHANATLPMIPGSGAFVRSTNGLASGNVLVEAALHGVCEVIERDAYALWEQAGGEESATLLDPASVADLICRELVTQIQAAKIDVLIWRLTSDIGVPVFRVALFDHGYDVDLNPAPVPTGMGCHPDPGVALSRALTEACQSRLTIIAGSRDDLSRQRYRGFQAAVARAHYQELLSRPRLASFEPTAFSRAPVIEDELREIIAKLRAVGAGPVIGVDLSLPDWPVSVVRIIIPGLEGPSEHVAYRAGPRAKRAKRSVT